MPNARFPSDLVAFVAPTFLVVAMATSSLAPNAHAHGSAPHGFSSDSDNVTGSYVLTQSDNPWAILGFKKITYEAAVFQHPLAVDQAFRRAITRFHPDKQRNDRKKQISIDMSHRIYAARDLLLVDDVNDVGMPNNSETQDARVKKAKQASNGGVPVGVMISSSPSIAAEVRVLLSISPGIFPPRADFVSFLGFCLSVSSELHMVGRSFLFGDCA